MYIYPEFNYRYDHDVTACAQCHLTGNYFQDGPCPQCGHTFTGQPTTYYQDQFGRNWKTEWRLCARCAIVDVAYAGTSVFSYDETGPGDDLSGYRIITIDHHQVGRAAFLNEL